MAIIINGKKIAGTGKPGKSAYETAIESGYAGVELDFYKDLGTLDEVNQSLTDDRGEVIDVQANYYDKTQIDEKLAEIDVSDEFTAHNSDPDAHEAIRNSITTGDANTLTSANEYTDTQISKIPTPDVSGQIGEHNSDETAHPHLLDLINNIEVPVTSVNGKTGDVVLNAADVDALPIRNEYYAGDIDIIYQGSYLVLNDASGDKPFNGVWFDLVAIPSGTGGVSQIAMRNSAAGAVTQFKFRHKGDNGWSPWSEAATIDTALMRDGSNVMTGDLSIKKSTPRVILNNSSSGTEVRFSNASSAAVMQAKSSADASGFRQLRLLSTAHADAPAGDLSKALQIYSTETGEGIVHVYHEDNKPTAADVGAVALDGSNAMTGNLIINKTTPIVNLKDSAANSSGLIFNANNRLYLQAQNSSSSDQNRRQIQLADSNAQVLNKALHLVDIVNGTATGYSLYGEHNKPTAADVGASKAITGITRSGTTFTATHIDGTTSTFTQQDNNTTYSAATQSANGLMSAADKTKLDGIATGANKYSLPTATSSVLGGVKVGSNITVSSGTISLTKDNVTTALGYTPPTTNTTYSVVSTSADGLAPKRDGSTSKFLRGDGTWATPPDTNTTYSNFVKSGSGAKAGLVPAPSTTAGTTKYLREDGTWQVPPNTDTNTHYTTRIYAGASGTAANAAATSPYIKITDDNTYRNQIRLVGGGATTVTSDANGNITISSTDTNTNTKNTAGSTNTTSKIFLIGATSQAANPQTYSNSAVYATNGALVASTVSGAVWNDYAEYREADTVEAGRVVCENGDDTLSLSTERLQAGANIVSDTFGFSIGETDAAKTPIAVSGRVLAYPYEDRDTYKPGDAVCAAPNGTVSKMTREEIREYPERIIGTVSSVPAYETWGTGDVKVNGRIWIKVH